MGNLRASTSVEYGAEIVVACDARRGAAAALAGSFPDCRIIQHPEEIDWTAVQAVFVCTPPSERGPVENWAARQGVAVFMEKPIGLTAAKVEELRETFRTTGTLTAVGYMNRYRASIREARARLVDATILGATGYWFNDVYRVPWWSDTGLSGGAVNEQATHLIDLLRFLVGEVESVQAVAAPHPDLKDFIGTAAISVRCEGDLLCSLLYSCRRHEKAIGLRVFTDDGEVFLRGWDLELDDASSATPLGSGTDRNRIFYEETAAFLDAVVTRSPDRVLCDFEDAFRTQEVVDAVMEAIRQGSTVSLADRETR